MKYWSTPSEKAHYTISPKPPRAQKNLQEESILILWAKRIIGTPIPPLLLLYSIALLTSISAIEILGGIIVTLTLFYMLLDTLGKRREFKFFMIPGFFSLIGFIIIVYLGLVINAPEANIWGYFHIHWVAYLFVFPYTLFLFPGLNRIFTLLIVAATIISIYAIIQHFTGLDLNYLMGLRDVPVTLPARHSDGNFYSSRGFFSHYLSYGYVYTLVICFSIAALLLGKKQTILFKTMTALSCLLIGFSLVFTYGRGVWMAACAAVLFMALYISKRIFFLVLSSLLGVFILMYSTSNTFSDRFDTFLSTTYSSNKVRINIWKANMAMFADHPWIGIGYKQNHFRTAEYYEKLGIKEKFIYDSHNNYIETLATTGILGFLFYMLFILSFLFANHQLLMKIPKTHYWHRVFALGILGGQIAIHVGGLTIWTWGDSEMYHIFVFLLSCMAYMYERYSNEIIPSDHSL